MASGGYRPGGGRPKGATDKAPRKRRKDAKKQQVEVKKKAIRKKREPGPAAAATEKQAACDDAEAQKHILAALDSLPQAGVPSAVGGNMQPDGQRLAPLDYMLNVINDPHADPDRRDKLAIAAAPFLHAKPGEKGKKQDRDDRAKAASAGRFAPRPLKVVKG